MPPPDVVRRDGDDSYLVVAADKGTGAFSDVANALAAEYGYWLGDAFASGGSAGFDHKEMGITSRGAWLSVKAHFRAARRRRRHRPPDGRRHRRHVGRRVRQRVCSGHRTCSSSLRSTTATCSSIPIPIRRRRSRSGGGCSSCRRRRGPTTTPRCSRRVAACTRARRSRSTCRTPPAACSASATACRALTPDEVVSAILRAPVDLLWNGGIGTFVKASTETERRRRRPHQRRGAHRRHRAAVPGGRRGRQPRVHAAGPGRVRARGRAHQHRRHRQLGRRRHLRPRGEHQDPPAARDRHRALAADRARRAPRDDDRRRWPSWCSPTTKRRRTRSRSPRSRRPIWSGCTRARWNGSSRPPGSTARSRRSRAPRCCRSGTPRDSGSTSPELAVLLAYTKLELQRALVASDVPDDPYLHDRLRRVLPAVAAHRLRRRALVRTRCAARSSPPSSPTRS